MSNKWPIHDAEWSFDELLDAAIHEGPQILTRHGVDAAVVIEVQHWRRLKRKAAADLKELLLASEARTEHLAPPRRKRRRRESVALD